MPEYKRKRVKKSLFRKKQKIKKNNNIVFNDTKENINKKSSHRNIKVLRGAKYIKNQRTKIIFGVVAIIVAFFVVFSVTLPGGLFENAVNFVSLLGPGSYPIQLSGNNVINSVSNGSYFYVLTDTNITAYSNGGKTVFDEFHGFSNPILSVTNTRALVYDQGGKSAYIYNLSGKIETLELKEEIITASISQNGHIAVATTSDRNASVVTVYNKNLKEIFAWNSAIDIINNVLVNNSGNRLAITTLKVTSGEYESKLMIFNFDSADPLHTLELGNSIPLSITNTGRGISVICNDKYKFLHWKKFTTNEIVCSGEINQYRNAKNGILLTFNLANNRNENTVVLISKKGTKISEFKINNAITDIQYSNGRVYALNDTLVNIYDKNGKILRHSSGEYGTIKFAVISSNSIAAILDSEIIKTTIEKD